MRSLEIEPLLSSEVVLAVNSCMAKAKVTESVWVDLGPMTICVKHVKAQPEMKDVLQCDDAPAFGMNKHCFHVEMSCPVHISPCLNLEPCDLCLAYVDCPACGRGDRSKMSTTPRLETKNGKSHEKRFPP